MIEANRIWCGIERELDADLSELIVDGKTSLDLSGFRFSRFAEGAVGRPRNVL